MPPIPRRSIHLPAPGTKRAVVIGAGSFGTAVAVLLARGGLRTTLQTRTREQAQQLAEDRDNRAYLPGVELPRELRIESVDAGLARADYVFLGVPSSGLEAVIDGLEQHGLPAAGGDHLARERARPTRRDAADATPHAAFRCAAGPGASAGPPTRGRW